MSLTVCVLASGSSGNCVYVSSDSTRMLIDAGISCKETTARLLSLDVEMADINAICVTHEHSDHKEALGVISRRFGTPVYANGGAVEAMEGDARMKGVDWNVFTTGQSFPVGDLKVEPFSVPHDSYEPVGFVISCADARVGVVTDMGMSTSLIRERLRDCDVAVVECNHDEQLLRDSGRPWSLKQRILGRQGHLSNTQAADLLSDVSGERLKTVFLAHLSSDCNEPDLAMKVVTEALEKAGVKDVDVKLTYRSRVSDLVSV